MTDIVANVWRCPRCGKQFLEPGNDLEYGDILCDACNVPLEFAGHQDITVEESND